MNHRHAAILACLLCPLPVVPVAFFWSPETVPASVIPSYRVLPAISHYVRQRSFCSRVLALGRVLGTSFAPPSAVRFSSNAEAEDRWPSVPSSNTTSLS